MHEIFTSLLLTAPIAQAEGTPPGGGAGAQFLILGLLFAGMWFLIIAPQRKRQKQHDSMVKALKSGDEVLTNGGIYGTIVNVKSDRLVIKIAEGTRVEVARHAVASLANTSEKVKESPAEDNK